MAVFVDMTLSVSPPQASVASATVYCIQILIMLTKRCVVCVKDADERQIQVDEIGRQHGQVLRENGRLKQQTLDLITQVLPVLPIPGAT